MAKLSDNDLNELINAQVISPEIAAQINRYYQTRQESSNNRLPVVLSVLGALLGGLGISLVVAHNWDEISKLSKTIIAFIPLLLGQALCVFTLLSRKDSAAWREGSAVFLFFATGTCIALISQVYNIQGILSDFLFTWCLLVVPLVYIMRSHLAALLHIALITWFVATASDHDQPDFPAFLYWPLLAIIVPHYYRLFKATPHSNYTYFHHWMLAGSLSIALAMFPDHYADGDWAILAYLLLFAIFYMTGNLPPLRENKGLTNPFRIIGSAGTVIVMLWLSFEYPWNSDFRDDDNNIFKSHFTWVLLPLLLLALVQLYRSYQKKSDDRFIIDPVHLPFLFMLVSVILLNQVPALSTFISNMLVLAIAIHYIWKGAAQNLLGILNYGLLIFTALAICRFFDSSIPFSIRGFFFLLAGASFIVANILVINKRKAAQQNKTT
jgi:uncharacterized membrane protein